MSRERGMFRVYQCPRCKNVGYAIVEQESDESRCSLCQGIILHEPGTIYAVTMQEAQSNVKELVIHSRQEKNKGGTVRSLGIKKRVYYIVEALIDLNRGRPVTIEDVLRECSDAGIDLNRAISFLDKLESEGVIIRQGSSLLITGEVI